MNGIEELLRSKGFAASLLNGPCPSKKDKNDYTPINPDWIDEKASDAVTDAFHKLLPCSFPYMTYIVVEMNPDTLHGGTCVDANDKRLRSKGFAASLLNGPYPSKKDKNDYTPINPDWIDEKASDAVTDAFHKLLPCSFPYMTYILVEMNPDTLHGGTCVDANDKRQRYFVITVIPDTK